jgi:hypothetical protein
MTAAKQPRGNAGKGRKKGVPNRVTGDVREMIRMTLRAAGEDCGGRGRRAGVAYLRKQAHENPKAFMALLGKIVPTTIETDGAPILLEEIVLLALERRADEAETQPEMIDATPALDPPGVGASVGNDPPAG